MRGPRDRLIRREDREADNVRGVLVDDRRDRPLSDDVDTSADKREARRGEIDNLR